MVEGSLDALDDDRIDQLRVADSSRLVCQLHVRKRRHQDEVGLGILRSRADKMSSRFLTSTQQQTSTSVYGDGRISTHAEGVPGALAVSGRDWRLSAILADMRADSSDFGLLGKQTSQNWGFSAQNAPEPPCKI